MESTGPKRPNLINRWTKYQAQEHPEQFDLDDGVVVVKEVPKKSKPSKLRFEPLYQDTILVEGKPPTLEKEKPFFPRVKVELFLESLCPDTHNFVRGPLSKIVHDPFLLEVIDLQIFVFGKGSLVSVEPQQFQCQHGPNECYGNMVENCVVKYTSPEDTVDILTCLYTKRKFDEHAISLCTKGLDDGTRIKDSIVLCTQGEGKHLLFKAFERTPRLSYVPSMRINKGPVIPADFNLKNYICSEYKGEKPGTCP